MSFGGWLLAGGMFLWLKHEIEEDAEKQRKAMEEEARRKKTPCYFLDGFTKMEFAEMVARAAKPMKKRLSVSADDLVIHGYVNSMSGISTWKFTLDFNDYGKFTGKYWLDTENDDSAIPERLANNIISEVNNYSSNTNSGKKPDAEPKTKYDYDVDDKDEPLRSKGNNANTANDSVKEKRHLIKMADILLLLIVATIGIAVMLYVVYLNKLTVVGISSEDVVGRRYESVVSALEASNFKNITTQELDDLDLSEEGETGTVSEVVIGDDTVFSAETEYPNDIQIIIRYHSLRLVQPIITSKEAQKKNCEEICAVFAGAGFVNIQTEPIYDLITGWIISDGSVEEVLIDNSNAFETNYSYRPDAEVVIRYHTFRN